MVDGRIEHPQLLSFFNGAYDLIRGAFSAGEDLSDESKGSSRELVVHDALANVLPPFVRLEQGDIIDSEGNKTGQLDHVVIEHRSPTLKVSPSGSGFILAEGVLGVIELKSDISKQWSQVETLFKHLIPVVPCNYAHSVGGSVDVAIPLFIVGATGWSTEQIALEKLTQLVGMPGNEPRRHVFMLDLAHRRLVAHLRPHEAPEVLSFANDQRGALLGELVLQLTARARALGERAIPYRAYAQRRRLRDHEPPHLHHGHHELVTSPKDVYEESGRIEDWQAIGRAKP